MKKHIPLITLLCILFLYAISFIYGCKKKDTIQNSNRESVVFVYDITDKSNYEITHENLEELLGLNKDPYKGLIIQISSISDLTTNQEKTFNIAPTNYLMSNDKIRRENIAELYSEITSEITKISTSDDKSQSHIFESIIGHANDLSREQSSKKTLYIWSDLRENSSKISLYKNKYIQLLLTNPDEFTERLTDGISITDLKDLTIIIIYQPKNIEDDKIFQALKPVYEKIFTAHGAHIIFKPNL